MSKLKLLLTFFATCCALTSLAQETDGYFDSNGVKIHYATAGEGEAVVLIHGWMGDSTMWGKDAAGNTKLGVLPGFRSIALDCRGHGKSDKLYDPAKYGPEMAADVVRLLDHLKIKKAHLIGYSMGAFIAGKVAAMNPDRVISVIYGGQAPLIEGQSNGSTEIDTFAKAVDEGNGLGSYILAVSPPGGPKLNLEQANALANYVYKGKDVKAFAAAGRSFPKLAVKPDDLAKGKAPVLFIYGSKEPESLKTRAETWRKTLGQGEVKVVEGADHITTVAKPEFGLAILEFLKAQKGK